MSPHSTALLHLTGWVLFLVCALLFIISGVASGDMLLLAGSIVFLLGCLAFIVPLVADLRSGSR